MFYLTNQLFHMVLHTMSIHLKDISIRISELVDKILLVKQIYHSLEIHTRAPLLKTQLWAKIGIKVSLLNTRVTSIVE